MKKIITTNNVIILALVVMVCLNLFSLYMLHTAKQEMRADRQGPGRLRKEPKYLIIDKLGFSKEQIDEYEALIREHRRVVKQTRRDVRKLKKELFSLLYLPLEDPRVQKLMTEIDLENRELEDATFEHFRQVRALCSEKQKKEFDRIINRVLEMMSVDKPPPPPPPPHWDRDNP